MNVTHNIAKNFYVLLHIPGFAFIRESYAFIHGSWTLITRKLRVDMRTFRAFSHECHFFHLRVLNLNLYFTPRADKLREIFIFPSPISFGFVVFRSYLKHRWVTIEHVSREYKPLPLRDRLPGLPAVTTNPCPPIFKMLFFCMYM